MGVQPPARCACRRRIGAARAALSTLSHRLCADVALLARHSGREATRGGRVSRRVHSEWSLIVTVDLPEVFEIVVFVAVAELTGSSGVIEDSVLRADAGSWRDLLKALP